MQWCILYSVCASANRGGSRESQGDKKKSGLVFVISLCCLTSYIFPVSAVKKAGVFGDIIAPCGLAKQQHKAPKDT